MQAWSSRKSCRYKERRRSVGNLISPAMNLLQCDGMEGVCVPSIMDNEVWRRDNR